MSGWLFAAGTPSTTRLALLVASVREALRDELSTLLAAERFAEPRGAVERLGDRAYVAAGLSALAEAEATRLVELLQARAEVILDAALPPGAALTELAAIDGERRVGLVLLGVRSGFDARWEGARADDDGVTARAEPGADRVRVHVHGRAERDDQRCILVAEVVLAPSEPAA